MNSFVKKLLPHSFFKIIRLFSYSFKMMPIDFYWFKFDLLHSFTNARTEKAELAELLITSHVLEKGITMPKRRLGFGYERVRSIIKRCNKAIKRYSENHVEVQSTLKDLEQYLQLHHQENFHLPEDIENGIVELLKYKRTDTVECFESTPDNLFKNTKDFYEFAHSRHTVRWYSEEKINKNDLIKAIELAQTAPSACNRQSTHVYIIENDKKKELAFGLQNGNRGFGHLADKLLLITSDMNCWSLKTRTSAYLDAGIFTQNLLYALHYYKICACTLNAHLSIKQLKELKNIVGYKDSEFPIVFISIGKAPEHFMIAGSQRLDSDQIYNFV